MISLKDLMDGNLNTIKYFINKDNVNDIIYNNNWTALHYASGYNKLDIVKYLLSIGADWNLKNDYGLTPLDIAKVYNNIEVKEYLQLYIRFNKK